MAAIFSIDPVGSLWRPHIETVFIPRENKLLVYQDSLKMIREPIQVCSTLSTGTDLYKESFQYVIPLRGQHIMKIHISTGKRNLMKNKCMSAPNASVDADMTMLILRNIIFCPTFS